MDTARSRRLAQVRSAGRYVRNVFRRRDVPLTVLDLLLDEPRRPEESRRPGPVRELNPR